MKKKISSTAIFIAGIMAGIISISLLAFREERNDPESKTQVKKQESVQRVTAPTLPAAMEFAGEKVPLERWEIREQLDREVLYNYFSPGNIIYLLKLSGRYFPMIEERLKEQGVPDDFKYLCVAESNLNNAISRVGATGFWQFMRGTAPGYDIEVNSNVDERYHVMKSTDAACAYLKDAYAKFGSWTAAAASYNCGMGGYNGQATYQGTKNYYDLLLPEETQRYIFRILAFKYILSDPDHLGFDVPETERYVVPKTRSVTVSSSIPNLAAYAQSNGTTYKMIRWLNPWIRGRSLVVGKGKTYTLLLPMQN